MLRKQNIIENIKATLFYLIIGIILYFAFIKPVIIGTINKRKQDEETITNREWKEFKEWEQKQEEKEWENSEFGK
jgi:flagellar biosynthesis/type III secretory pathway M-ring protein FliF/YscJ